MLRRVSGQLAALNLAGAVRTPLACTELVEIGRWPAMRNAEYFLDDDLAPQELRPEFDPDSALPDRAVMDIYELSSRPRPNLHFGLGHVLARSTLVVDALRSQQRVVLIGDPGSGKSTVLQDLSRGADGGPDGAVFSLRALNARPAEPVERVVDAFGRRLPPQGLVLVDGLDEVARPDVRVALAGAVADLASRRPDLAVVLSCRPAAFVAVADLLPWPRVTIAPLTLGQVRHLVCSVLDRSATEGPPGRRQAEAVADALVSAMIERPWLCELVRTPLMAAFTALLMVPRRAVAGDDHGDALLHPLLQEPSGFCELGLGLLLEGWDAARGLPRIADFARLPHWSMRDTHSLLDRIAVTAHRAAPEGGRGLVEEPRDDEERRALQALAERSGLMTPTRRGAGEWSWPPLREHGARSHDLLLEVDQPIDRLEFPQGPAVLPWDPPRGVRGRTRLGFSTLTMQEHATARYLTGGQDPVAVLHAHRHGDRWAVPILQAAGQLDTDRLARWIAALVVRRDVGHDKAVERWHRDLVIAARILIQGAGAGAELRLTSLGEDVRAGLVTVLADQAQPLLEAERIEAARMLGVLQDPRYPVTVEQWREQVTRARDQAGGLSPAVDDYFVVVPGGVDERAGVLFVARYPLTWEQWRVWPEAPAEQLGSSGPPGQNEPATMFWRHAQEFCGWLAEQTAADLGLPTEIQWEAAAGGGDGREYPWGEPPTDDRAWGFVARARRGLFGSATVPVGCYPAGAARCGAMDLAGNVAEWTIDTWRTDVGGAPAPAQRHVQRGGGYAATDDGLRCAGRSAPGDHDRTAGLRVVLMA